MSQVQDKNVKLRFSYKVKKDIVVLYVTLCLVCHTKQTSLWNRGALDHGWRDVELLLQLSGRPQDL